jgi:hypothetical protein
VAQKFHEAVVLRGEDRRMIDENYVMCEYNLIAIQINGSNYICQLRYDMSIYQAK